jgi:hypothetical protein
VEQIAGWRIYTCQLIYPSPAEPSIITKFIMLVEQALFALLEKVRLQ